MLTLHILALLLGAIGAVVFFLWRAGLLFRRGKEVVEAVDDARAAWRRHRFQRPAAYRPLSEIDDPKAAASVVIVFTLTAERDLTEEDRAAARAAMAETFAIDEEEATALLAEAEFATRGATDPGFSASRMARVLSATCSRDELMEVAALAQQSAGGALTDRQRTVLDQYRKAAGIT